MRRWWFLLLVPVLTGCSSVSMLEERQVAALAPVRAPETVWVRPFEVPRAAEFDAASPVVTAEDEDARERVGRLIAEGVLSRADNWIAQGRLLEPGAPVPSGGLLIEGKVLRTRQGSRALRLGIGFGAGRTQLETSVRVYYLDRSATEPWLTFETTGGSNMEPGLIGMLVPSPVAIPVAVSIIGGAATAGAIGGKGITQDATRTGRTIAAAVHDKLVKAGALERRTSVKRAGRLSTPLGEVPVAPPEF